MDVSTSEKEIADSIGKCAGLEEGQAKVVYKKETEMEEVAALVELSRRKVDAVCRVGKLEIGWVIIECTIR